MKHHCPVFCGVAPNHAARLPPDCRAHAERNGCIGLSLFLSSGLRAGLVFKGGENTAWEESSFVYWKKVVCILGDCGGGLQSLQML